MVTSETPALNVSEPAGSTAPMKSVAFRLGSGALTRQPTLPSRDRSPLRVTVNAKLVVSPLSPSSSTGVRSSLSMATVGSGGRADMRRLYLVADEPWA